MLNIKTVREGAATFINEQKRGHLYLVAVEKGEIIGLVSYLIHGRPVHGLCELYHIIVSPKARGRGVARSLFNALIKHTNQFYHAKKSKLRKLFVMTRATNIKAQAFYKKMGLKYEATLKEHFYKKRDEFILSKFFT